MNRLRCLLLFLLCAMPAAPADADQSTYRFGSVERVVAFADVHGAYDELVALLRETAVIDAASHWRGGKTHLVSLGDLVDRGPESRKVLDLLMRLETEAREAGGAVHVLLGNHEVMNIVGDLRYVSAAEYAAFAGGEDAVHRETAWRAILARDAAASRAAFDATYPDGYFAHRQAFSPSGKYGAWLLAKPFLIVVNDTAFVHAGLSPMVTRLGLETTNATLHAQLVDYLRSWQAIAAELELAAPMPFHDRAEALLSLGAEAQSQAVQAWHRQEIFTPAGPTWFRGQALCYPYTETANLDAALAKLEVSRVIAGHTVSPVGRVLRRFDERVLLLDTGMLRPVYGGTPSALVFEKGQWAVAYADRPGQRLQPDALRRAVGPRPRGLDDDALERWLLEAEVIETEELDAGITEPQRVTLRKDGIELRAVFKQLSTDFGSQGRTRALNEADRFEYELAAYALDRLLGLGMVPVTVARTIDNRRGILQFWIDESFNLQQMLQQKLQPDGWCALEPQYNLMNVFDMLIHNTDRTQQNALFTRDWMLVLIDHSRAFPTFQRDPPLLYRGETTLPASLAERLASLDRATLEAALGRYLHRRQIDALLQRRDRLLDEYRSGAGVLRKAAQ
ncbi:MAG: metallophosphoesterase [Steroidobacteraceae bacterium]